MRRRDFLGILSSLPFVGKLIQPAETSPKMPDLDESYRQVRSMMNQPVRMQQVKDGRDPRIWVTKNTGKKRYLDVGDMSWFDFLDKDSRNLFGVFSVFGDRDNAIGRTLISHALATKMSQLGSKVVLFDQQFPYQDHTPQIPVITSSQAMSWMFTDPQQDRDRWAKAGAWFQEMARTAHQHETAYVISMPTFKRPWKPMYGPDDDICFGYSFGCMLVSSMALRVRYDQQYDEQVVEMLKNRWWPGPQRGDACGYKVFGDHKTLVTSFTITRHVRTQGLA